MNKLLIANRGEIALRVMRTAREMGITTVAVYSEADRDALHVRYADEAYCIGAPPSAESYLRGEKIIQTALDCGADAVHPGYGFLSENAGFAEAVVKAGIAFVGPPAAAMKIMGNKLAAKSAVSQYDIPMVPGSAGAISEESEAKQVAQRIGYPILVKAAAGGGGKGMRVVENDAELDQALSRARSEAESAFGDGSVFIERFITNPRHVEIQIVADAHGNTCYVFERECSIQRRHQKVVEEAPSPIVTADIRQEMGEAAINVARACGYVGAGTVEFLVDASSSQFEFYFLEMNTRLQVEHPITEMIAGLDLVKEQLQISDGKPLSFSQSDLNIRGHAIELRVYAEDPLNNFLPSVAQLMTYVRPQGPGVRVDDGYEQGMDIPIYYDPLISKLIVHGRDRNEAIQRMQRAIAEYHITGPATTLPFGGFVMNHASFAEGNYNTNFVKEHFKSMEVELSEEEELIAAIAAAEAYASSKPKSPVTTNGQPSRWKKARTDWHGPRD